MSASNTQEDNFIAYRTTGTLNGFRILIGLTCVLIFSLLISVSSAMLIGTFKHWSTSLTILMLHFFISELGCRFIVLATKNDDQIVQNILLILNTILCYWFLWFSCYFSIGSDNLPSFSSYIHYLFSGIDNSFTFEFQSNVISQLMEGDLINYERWWMLIILLFVYQLSRILIHPFRVPPYSKEMNRWYSKTQIDTPLQEFEADQWKNHPVQYYLKELKKLKNTAQNQKSLNKLKNSSTLAIYHCPGATEQYLHLNISNNKLLRESPILQNITMSNEQANDLLNKTQHHRETIAKTVILDYLKSYI